MAYILKKQITPDKQNEITHATRCQMQHNNITDRARTFFTKMEERAQEIMEEARVSGQLVADADSDPFKRSFLQFKGAIIAQFMAIIQKGSTTYQTQIMPNARGVDMIALSQLFNSWHTKVLTMMNNAFDNVIERNLEQEYKDIMESYNLVRDKFNCRQCGAKLTIKQFYFHASYITCEYCQTQNTFDPGTKARMMEHIARPLAESRCLEQYEHFREERSKVGAKAAAPAYEAYLKAMIQEMDELLPGLNEQHQHFYNRMINDYHKLGIAW